LRYFNKKKRHALISYLIKELKEGNSVTILIVGKTNSGKSWTALTICEWFCNFWGKTFKPSESVFIDFKKFIINFFDSEKKPFVIDEAKKYLDKKRWWEDFAKDFGDLLATQRYRQNLYIIILPLAKTLVTDSRDMIDVIIEMKRPAIASVYLIKKRWSEIQHFELWKFYIGDMIIKKPSERVIKEYQAIERPNKEEVYYDILGRVIKFRRCPCGKKIKFLEKECPSCGERLDKESIYILLKKYVKR